MLIKPFCYILSDVMLPKTLIILPFTWMEQITLYMFFQKKKRNAELLSV